MDLLKDDLNRVFRRYLFASLGSALVMTIYSCVDLICVGHYCGPNGAAAISCVNPLWSILISIGLLFGVGGSIRMTNLRGAGEKKKGDESFTAALVVALCLSAALMWVYLFKRETLLRFFGANDTLLPYAMDYSQWIAWAAPAFLIGTALTNFIRNDGAPELCAAAIISGGVFNIFGDVYFVFDFGLGMGMSGAGLATAIGQYIALAILCSYFFRKRCTLHLRRCRDFFKTLGGVLASGFAPAIVDITFGVTVIFFNRQIMRYAGTNELAVFGTVANIAILFQSMFYGVGQAVQPIVSANFGAGERGRVLEMRRISMKTAVTIGLLFFGLTAVFPQLFLKLFMSVTPEVLAVGVPALRIYALSFLFMGVNVVSAYYLGSILLSQRSLVISLSRGLVLSVTFVMLLPALLGFSAIWWTMPAAELLTMAYSIYCMKNVERFAD